MNQMNKRKTMYMQLRSAKERGQALLLIAVLMVAMLGALGLAIDGGGMFLLWRDAQNAVDAAALQAAFTYCTADSDRETQAIDAAEISMQNNGFTDSGTINVVDADVQTELIITLLRQSDGILNPITGMTEAEVTSAGIDASNTFFVQIEEEKPAYFIQLVYGGPLKVTVTALGACDPGGSIFEGFGVFSMGNDSICAGNSSVIPVDFTGSDQHYWSNIYSNGSAKFNGGNNGIVFHDSSGVVAVDGLEGGSTPEDYDSGEDLTLEAEPATEYDEFPTLFELQWFAPPSPATGSAARTGSNAGVIWDAVLAYEQAEQLTNPTANYLHYPGDGTIPAFPSNGNIVINDMELEGLLFIYRADDNYRITFGGGAGTNNFLVGNEGLTVVTNGRINASANIQTQTSAGWRSFTSVDNNATDVGGTESLSFFSTQGSADASTDPLQLNCSTGENDAAVSLSGKTWGNGIIYAPYSTVSFSGESTFWCGAVISLTMTNSASILHIFGSEVPPVSRLTDEGQLPATHWFTTRDYSGTGCDFFSNSPASYSLGDRS